MNAPTRALLGVALAVLLAACSATWDPQHIDNGEEPANNCTETVFAPVTSRDIGVKIRIVAKHKSSCIESPSTHVVILNILKMVDGVGQAVCRGAVCWKECPDIPYSGKPAITCTHFVDCTEGEYFARAMMSVTDGAGTHPMKTIESKVVRVDSRHCQR